VKKLLVATRIMQAAMLAAGIGGLITGYYSWVPASFISFFVTMIPAVLRRNLNLVLPSGLTFWIALTMFLHAVGGSADFYATVPGWDHLTHMMSGSMIGVLGFVIVVILDKYVKSIYLPRPFLALFVVMLVMGIGVLWEIMEFANDSLLHTHLQYGLGDTMWDLFFDGIAGFLAAIIGLRYLAGPSADEFVESMNIDDARKKVEEMVQKRKKPKEA